MIRADYSGIKRGLNRKLKQAKRDGAVRFWMDVDFADNIVKALDELIFFYKAHEKAEDGET
ncbi:MAG: hypothetical protein J6T17_07460 [Clostridia bacterium]|nr:hypothetical protein [Clostridia bacterium]